MTVNKKNADTVSECTCRGLNLLEKISKYYVDRFEDLGEPEISKTKLYKDAKGLSNDIFNKLTDKGVKYPGDLPPVKSLEKDITIKFDLESCNSYSDSSCVILLERLMGRLHQSPEAQNKLICGHRDNEAPYLDQQNVDNFLTDIFRGEFYGGKSSDILEIKHDPFTHHFPDKHIDMCKKYKK